MKQRSILMISIRVFIVVTMLGAALPAQVCSGPSGVVFSNSGVTCSFFGQAATMSGRFDARACSLTLTQTIPQTCCNTFATMTFMLIGAVPFQPGLTSGALLPGCEIGLVPFAVVPGPAIGGSQTLNLAVPAPVVPYTIYVQGVNQFFTTIGGSTELQTTDVLNVTIL